MGDAGFEGEVHRLAVFMSFQPSIVGIGVSKLSCFPFFLSAGTKLPMWAIRAMRAVWRVNRDRLAWVPDSLENRLLKLLLVDLNVFKTFPGA